MPEIKPQITFDDFNKLDLRVGAVTECSEHPAADKLLVLKVDLGDQQRQLVAGLKGHYQPAELVGKQVIVAVNLAARMMRGIESQGMLLAAVEEGDSGTRRVVCLAPAAAVRPGTPCS